MGIKVVHNFMKWGVWGIAPKCLFKTPSNDTFFNGLGSRL